MVSEATFSRLRGGAGKSAHAILVQGLGEDSPIELKDLSENRKNFPGLHGSSEYVIADIVWTDSVDVDSL